MKIELKRDALVGEVEVPKGEYLVSVRSDTQQIMLVGRGKEILVAAKKRPGKRKVRVHDALLIPGGSDQVTLQVKAPPQNEYVAFLIYNKRGPKKKSK